MHAGLQPIWLAIDNILRYQSYQSIGPANEGKIREWVNVANKQFDDHATTS